MRCLKRPTKGKQMNNRDKAYMAMLEALVRISKLPQHPSDDARNAATLSVAIADAQKAAELGSRHFL